MPVLLTWILGALILPKADSTGASVLLTWILGALILPKADSTGASVLLTLILGVLILPLADGSTQLPTAPGCRYTNKPWGDCDPATWLRTKTVKLAKGTSEEENCPDEKEFSQPCSSLDLPPGTKQLLEKESEWRRREEAYRFQLNRTRDFLDLTRQKLLLLRQGETSLSNMRHQTDGSYDSLAVKCKEAVNREKTAKSELERLREENKRLKSELKILKNSFVAAPPPTPANAQKGPPEPHSDQKKDKDDFLASIKRLNKEMKSQMEEHKAALTRCEEKMKTGQQEIGLDLVIAAKEELKVCRAQIEKCRGSGQPSKDDSYRNVTHDGDKEQERCRANLERSMNLLRSCQSQLSQESDRVYKTTVIKEESSEVGLEEEYLRLILNLRQEVERLHGAEMKIFDFLVEKLKKLFIYSKTSSREAQEKIKYQESYILLLKEEGRKAGAELSSLRSQVGSLRSQVANLSSSLRSQLAQLRQSRGAFEGSLGMAQGELGSLRDALKKLVGKMTLRKFEYVKKDEYNACLGEGYLLKKAHQEIKSSVSILRTAVEKFRQERLGPLLSNRAADRDKLRKEQQRRKTAEMIISQKEAELAAQSSDISTFLADFRRLAQDQEDNEAKLDDTAGLKHNLDRMRAVLQRVFTSRQTSRLELATCHQSLQGISSTFDKVKPILQSYRNQLATFRSSYLQKLIKAKEDNAKLLAYETKKNMACESSMHRLQRSLAGLGGLVTSFSAEFKRAAEQKFGLRTELSLEQQHEASNLEKMKKDLIIVRSGIQGIFSLYRQSLSLEKEKLLRLKQEYEVLQSKLRLEEGCRGQLRAMLVKEEECRVHLRQEQLHLYKCHVRYYKGKKVLKEVEDFYSSLLQRLSRLHEGIRTLRNVGYNLRKNLVAAHSTMGECTGNLQALRHECQGLVNWYQTQPNMDIIKRKLAACLEKNTENFKMEETPSFLLDHIKEQKEKLAKMAHQEEICEAKLKDSMREMLELSRSIQNTGKVAESYPRDEAVVKYLLQTLTDNKAKATRINQILYDTLTGFRKKASGEVYETVSNILDSWNMTSLASTEQGLNLLLRHNVEFLSGGSSESAVNVVLAKEEKLASKYEKSKAIIEKLLEENAQLKKRTTFEHRSSSSGSQEKIALLESYVHNIYNSFSVLREKNSDLIKKLNTCMGHRASQQPLKTERRMLRFPYSDRAVQEETQWLETRREEVLVPEEVKYHVDDQEMMPPSASASLKDLFVGAKQDEKTTTGKPFDIVKIQGLLNKTESITPTHVNLTITGSTESANASLGSISSELRSLQDQLQTKIISNNPATPVVPLPLLPPPPPPPTLPVTPAASTMPEINIDKIKQMLDKTKSVQK